MDYNQWNQPPYRSRGYGQEEMRNPYMGTPYGNGWHGMPYYQHMHEHEMPHYQHMHGHGMPHYQHMHGHGMPYHMAYPYSYPMFMQGDDDEKDLERLQSMMPETARVLQPIIEEECDRMEYDGSLMFEEYPDKVLMEQMVDRIYQRAQNASAEDSEVMESAMDEENVFATRCRNCGGNRLGDGVSDLIRVMLFDEMHRRRCRHRRCKRWW